MGQEEPHPVTVLVIVTVFHLDATLCQADVVPGCHLVAAVSALVFSFQPVLSPLSSLLWA